MNDLNDICPAEPAPESEQTLKGGDEPCAPPKSQATSILNFGTQLSVLSQNTAQSPSSTSTLTESASNAAESEVQPADSGGKTPDLEAMARELYAKVRLIAIKAHAEPIILKALQQVDAAARESALRQIQALERKFLDEERQKYTFRTEAENQRRERDQVRAEVENLQRLNDNQRLQIEELLNELKQEDQNH